MPLTLVLPLSTPLSLTALPTPPSLSTAPTTSPQNTIDNLVANLVDGMPVDGPSPSVVVGALGLAEGGGKTGMGAMKEELRAAERSQSRERGRVVRATLGAVRGSQGAFWLFRSRDEAGLMRLQRRSWARRPLLSRRFDRTTRLRLPLLQPPSQQKPHSTFSALWESEALRTSIQWISA